MGTKSTNSIHSIEHGDIHSIEHHHHDQKLHPFKFNKLEAFDCKLSDDEGKLSDDDHSNKIERLSDCTNPDDVGKFVHTKFNNINMDNIRNNNNQNDLKL